MTSMAANISPLLYPVDDAQDYYLEAGASGTRDLTVSILENQELLVNIESARREMRTGGRHLSFDDVFGG